MTRIAVLLSTYNGEKYLVEQLDSVLAQEEVELTLFVRDDGSRDSTADIVVAYQQKHANIRLEKAANVGVIRSFLALLASAGESFDYYAFCDQDDVWESRKLVTAVQALASAGTQPALYCSTTEVVDAELNHIGVSRSEVRPSFGNALLENIVTGCTAVMNGSLRQLMLQHVPQRAIMHDWWAYLLATAFGVVVFDPVPRIRYRQHGKNVAGREMGRWASWSMRFRNYLANPGSALSDQVAEFCQVFGAKLGANDRCLAEGFLAARQQPLMRLRLILSSAIYRQSTFDTWVVRFVIFRGLY